MTSPSRRSPAALPDHRARRRALTRGLGGAALATLTPMSSISAWAQSGTATAGWPARPVRIVQPFAAGGGGDIVSRLLAERMQAELGQPVVVENRTGAAGNIGAQYVARQSADGHTLMITSGGFAITPSLFKSLGYDPLKDFVAVTKIAIAPLLVLVRADSPIRSMADLIALARREPQAVNYASFGTGSPSHMIGESINRHAGIAMAHVPYTTGNGITDLMGGQVTVGIWDALSQTPQVKAGKLRALALNGTQRLPALPDVPTLNEAGIPFSLVGWHGMFAPAGTPRAIVDRLNRMVNQIIAQPDVRARLFELAMFPVQPPTTPEQWGAMFRQDMQDWGELVRRAGITPN